MALGTRGARTPTRRNVNCYHCSHVIEVSSKSMSTACPKCHKAVKIEDVVVKSYLPVSDLQTCGAITITKRGRVVAKNVHAGGGIICEGVLEGEVISEGAITLGPKSQWKGVLLSTDRLEIAEGAVIAGVIRVPRPRRNEPKQPTDTQPAS